MKGLSLFACGGVSEYYLHKTDVEIVVANELLNERCDFYEKKYGNVKMIRGDINDVLNDIIESCNEEGVEFVMATPPCQSFSTANSNKGNDTRTDLIYSVLKIIKEVSPKYVLIENVPSFIKSYNMDKTERIENVLTNFCNENGYNIRYKILNSADFETPQIRKRCIVLLSRSDMKVWEHPEPVTKEHITTRDVIGHLPSLESGESSDIPWHFSKTHNDRHILWMKHTPTGKTAFLNPVHYPRRVDGQRIKGYNTTYKRIEWDKPCPTITMANGSISSQNNVHPGNLKEDGIYSDARVLTIHELVLLTGLDEKWIPKDFPKKKEKILRELLGECFPPKFAYHIINSIPK